MSIKKTALLLGGYRVLSHTEVCANIGLYLMVSGAAGFSVILQTHTP